MRFRLYWNIYFSMNLVLSTWAFMSTWGVLSTWGFEFGAHARPAPGPGRCQAPARPGRGPAKKISWHNISYHNIWYHNISYHDITWESDFFQLFLKSSVEFWSENIKVLKKQWFNLMVWADSWRQKISIHPGFASRALTRTRFVNFRFCRLSFQGRGVLKFRPLNTHHQY